MRPFYLKGTEDGKEIYAKVVISKSVATADMLIRSPDDSWISRPKPFDLSKDDQHRAYLIFLERYFPSNFKEFDSARRRMQEAKTKSEQPKDPGEDSPAWRKEMLKKIMESRKNKPDENL